MIPNEIFDMLVVHEDVFYKRKDALCDITSKWFRTLTYMENNRDDAALRITKRLGLNVSDYDALLDGIKFPDVKTNQKLLGGKVPGLSNPGKRLSKIMLEEELISKSIDVNDAIEKSFAECFK